GNMDNLKMSPPCGGDIALRSTHQSAPAVFRPYFASSSARLMNKLSDSHKTQNQRFGSLLINVDFLRVGKRDK
ncbi:MAG: hypothetical protein LIO38_05310, partial [Cloacibacillus sp.]|nr:hypothetical protein [Cloacibacillus sp.]